MEEWICICIKKKIIKEFKNLKMKKIKKKKKNIINNYKNGRKNKNR